VEAAAHATTEPATMAAATPAAVATTAAASTAARQSGAGLGDCQDRHERGDRNTQTACDADAFHAHHSFRSPPI
jgi:hypothetical protein